MKTKNLLLRVTVILFTLPLLEAFAQQAPGRIQIVTMFDYPAKGLSTTPDGINDAGEKIVGRLTNSVGQVHGFIRFSDGSFSPPIVEPDGIPAGYTDVRGINLSGLFCGFFFKNDNLGFHGFLATDAGFTDFDIPGAIWTEPYGINNAGDFCGAYSTRNSGAHFHPFVDVGGAIETLDIADAITSFAYGINNSAEIVGEYIDRSSVADGFFRDAAGTLTAPIDFPDSTFTILFGLNDAGLMVERFGDSSGVERGFVLLPPDTFLVLDKPGATLTSLNGINNNNLMCGRVVDSSGIAHGILARLGQALAP